MLRVARAMHLTSQQVIEMAAPNFQQAGHLYRGGLISSSFKSQGRRYHLQDNWEVR